MLSIDASEARQDTRPAHPSSPDPAVCGLFLTANVYLFDRFLNLILCSRACGLRDGSFSLREEARTIGVYPKTDDTLNGESRRA